MIKFKYSKYQLQPVLPLSSAAGDRVREGALMMIQWPDYKVGYADLFPWPELGDQTLDKQLNLLSRGRLTLAMEQAIWLARSDAIARAQSKSLMLEVDKIRNHFLVNDWTKLTDKSLTEIRQAGYITLKIKMGRDLKEEILWLGQMLKKHPFMVRLDYNCKGELSAFQRMAQFFGQALTNRIEFIEDPIPYDRQNWMELSTHFRLAADYVYDQVDWAQKDPLPFQVLVLKPARQDVAVALENCRKHKLYMTVTSSMDHPVGIAHALRIASELKTKYPQQVLDSGCLSHRAYKPDIFSLSMISRGPYLMPILGTGIGFDSLLMGVEWKSVIMK